VCGLAGYITSKKHSQEAQARFKNILIQAEVRGTDACGIAFVVNKNRFFYAKAPKQASKFVKEKAYKKLLKKNNPTILIGHNRAKTQGDEANNMNNHPIVTKTGLILIHNGIIQNDKEVAKRYKLTLDAEVDSEVIVKLIEHYIYAKKKSTRRAIQLACKQIRGSMAFALLNDKEPRTLYLVARDNPVNLAFHIPTGTIYFASTEDILQNGLAKYDSYFQHLFYRANGMDEYVFKEMKEETGLKITQNNWDKFKVEEPEWNSQASARDDYESRASNQLTLPSGGRPIEVEQGTEEEIQEALGDCEGFDVMDRIIKPSKYLSDLLLYRLEYLQELFVSGEYQYHIDGGDSYEFNKLREEVVRIIHTLEKRQEKTKRDGLIIPELEEIWLIENNKFKKDIETNGEVGIGDFKSVGWVMTNRNPKVKEMLDKADMLDGMVGSEDTPPQYKDEYYCELCKQLVDVNRCTECGSVNLRTLDEVFEKESVEKEMKNNRTTLD